MDSEMWVAVTESMPGESWLAIWRARFRRRRSETSARKK